MPASFDRFNSWKALLYSDKLYQIADTLKDPLNPVLSNGLPTPVNWHIYPHNFCPHKCNFCIMDESMNDSNPFQVHFGEKQRAGQLSRETLLKAVDDAARLNVKLIHWSGGGEPLFNQNLPEAIFNQGKTNVKSAMSSNGLYLERLLDYPEGQARLTHLRISFNAGTPESYQKIGQFGWDRVTRNIRRAVTEKLADHIGMGFVLTHFVQDDTHKFVKLAEDLGVDFVHIRPAFWPKYNDEILSAVQRVANDPPKSDKVKVYCVTDKFEGFWNNNRSPCRATPLHAMLTATGEFAICQDRTDNRFGDYNVQSFEEIWGSPEHYDAIKKAQMCKIRCVETNQNNQIEHMFVNNDICRELL